MGKSRFYACRVPSLGRRNTIAATNQDQAVATAARLWSVPVHSVVVMFSYPATGWREAL